MAEVASIGGFVQQYQVIVDPARMRGQGISLDQVTEVIRSSNRDVGGRVVEMAETEYMVRGRGYLRSADDIADLPLRAASGTPVRIRDIATVELGPDERRGVAELNGEGEVVSGIVVARFGENALEVIDGVKARIEELKPGLPEGVEIKAVYDRSELIHRAIDTLTETLIQESIIVALVCVLFLLHVRSALVVIIMLPLGVLFSFICMRALGINSNIMSLGGIAIAIGEMVDAGVVMVENAHKHLERRGAARPRHRDPRRLPRGRAGAVLLAADHRGELPAGVHARGAGRAAVRAARVHQDLRDAAAARSLSVTLLPMLMVLPDPRHASCRRRRTR